MFEKLIQNHKKIMKNSNKITKNSSKIRIRKTQKPSALVELIFRNIVSKIARFLGLYDEKQTHAEVLQFVTLQMALHHPGGARTESEGAVVIDQDQWSSNLSRVFSNLVENTIHNINWRSRSRSFFSL